MWRHRHAAGETFVPHGYEVNPIGRPETADFLRDHHYLHKLPANRFRFGLRRGADLVGIAVFGPGMPHALGALFPDLEPAESVVLDRFALLDDVKAPGEIWFLARVFALLRSGGIEAVATFSDPWPRRDRHGRSVHVGHIGTVFQAASAIYTGLTARETLHQLHATGELIHRRALSKFRNGERSSRYLERVLLGVGAPPRWPNESPDAWLARVLPLVSSPYVHGGNHRYAFLIGRPGNTFDACEPLPAHHPLPRVTPTSPYRGLTSSVQERTKRLAPGAPGPGRTRRRMRPGLTRTSPMPTK